MVKGNRLLLPSFTEFIRRGVRVDLRHAGAIGGELEDIGTLIWRHRTSEICLSFGNQFIYPLLELFAPRRPRVREANRHALDLCDAVVVHLCPPSVSTSSETVRANESMS